MDFRILGPLEVDDDGRSVELGGARQRALLAILLLRRNEVVTADRLVEDLYAGQPPPTAAKSLQAHVSRLRKALPDGRLVTRGRGYVLHTDADEVDADRFARCCDTGRTALDAGDAETAEKVLLEALALWRGPPLGDLSYEEFAQSEIARLEELRLSTLEELADARLTLGRHAELVGELERLVTEHPSRERVRAQLMLALYRSGRQADALASYQEGRRTLVDELGIDPGRQLQDLERAILNHDPALDVARPDTATDDSAEARTMLAGAFVGRTRELDLLERALMDAGGGRGRLVLVSGEAGIGKSRLAEELASRARRRGFRVLSGRCWEAGGAPAYWPWVQAFRTHAREEAPMSLREQLGTAAADVAHLLPELRDQFPDIPEVASLESEGARFRLFDSTAGFVRRVAATQPLLLVLDDVHAADAPSLLLIAFLASVLQDSRIAIIATYREPELAPDDPTAAVLADVARHASSRIALRGLDESEVGSYIEQTAREEPSATLVAAIAAETDGNPLFVGEIVRLLAADGRLPDPSDESWRPAVPETVKEVIGRRLSRLSPPCRETLAAASVVGRDFSLSVVERLDTVPRDELLVRLDEAVAARLVTDVPGSPGQMRFTHALVRDTLYDGVPQSHRRELHRRTGEAIESIAGEAPAAHLSELSHHYFHALPAVDPDTAVQYARRAADHARALLAYEEAARLYERALQALVLCTVSDAELERRLLLALGEALTGAGDTLRAKDAFLRAAVVARESGAAEDLAAAALGYGGKIVWARPAGDRLVVALLEEALLELGSDDTPLRARLLARLTGALRDERDPGRRLQVGELAVATARRAGDTTALIHALLGLNVVQYALDDHSRRLEVFEELRELSRAADDREAEWQALNAEILLASTLNDFATVREQTRAAAELADVLRQPPQRWFARAMHALLALHEGSFAEAETLLADAYELGRHAHPRESQAAHAIQRYLLHREQGHADQAYEPLAQVAAESPARPFFRCALAALAVDLGRMADVRRRFEELAPNRFEIVPRDNEWPLSAAFLVEACGALGDTTRAAILYDELAPLGERSSANPPEGTLGAMARSLGIAAALLGMTAEATSHQRRAIEIDTATGAVPWVAYAQVELADVLAADGRQDEAESLRDRAAGTAAALGMQRLAMRIGSGRA